MRLKARHEAIGDVRAAGLSIGVELVQNRGTKAPATELTRRVVNAMRNRHVLISASGSHSQVLKIRPPLCLTTHQADLCLAALADALTVEGEVLAPARER